MPERADVPVVAIVSRLAKQKGVDVVAEAIYRLVNYDMQLVILGEGEIWTHFFFPNIAVKHPHKVACHIGYNESLAHKIEAGADFFLMPSRFEPCGLNQLYSLSYGTLPIVRATGGLNDTVDNYDEQTGEGRITSYNVCYTKLLRACKLGEGAAVVLGRCQTRTGQLVERDGGIVFPGLLE